MTKISALSLKSSLAWLVLTVSIHAQLYGPNTTPSDGHVPVPLWPSRTPGVLGTDESDVPTLTVYLPITNPTHTAIVMVPGGGYVRLAADHEGAQVGTWLSAHGIAAYVLHYRLGPRYCYQHN